MYNRRQLIWIGAGMIVALLAAILATIVVQAIIWTPLLIEIASVTWNNAPTA